MLKAKTSTNNKQINGYKKKIPAKNNLHSIPKINIDAKNKQINNCKKQTLMLRKTIDQC